MPRTLLQTPRQARTAEIEQATEKAVRAARAATDEAMKSIKQATDAAREAAAPQPPPPPAAPGTIVFPGTDGKDFTVKVGDDGIKVCEGESCATVPIKDIVPRGAVQMTYAVFGSLAFMIVGYPIARAFARWLDRRGQSVAPSRELQTRLETLERNIDTVAVEMERLGEGQRFTNKLLEQRPIEHAQRSDR